MVIPTMEIAEITVINPASFLEIRYRFAINDLNDINGTVWNELDLTGPRSRTECTPQGYIIGTR